MPRTDSGLMVNPGSIFYEWLNEQLKMNSKVTYDTFKDYSVLLLSTHLKGDPESPTAQAAQKKSQSRTCVRRTCKSLMKETHTCEENA